MVRLVVDWLQFARMQESRFWSKVTIGGEDVCWLWTGGKDKDGYGKFAITSPRALVPNGTPKQKHIRAHRMAWALKHGRFLNEDEYCLHSCDTPACVNEKHFFVGTALDNAIDCVAKGRSSRGERSGTAKLRVVDVQEIRRLYEAGVHRSVICEKFKISLPSFYNISRRRRSWQSVP